MNQSNDVLPPVKPPSAAFLIQLFVVPLAIVAGIVLVCVVLNWVTRKADPAELLAELSKGNPGSWQKALDAANLLNDPRNEELRRNSDLAAQLAKMLRERIDDGSLRDDQLKQRIFLCLALGVVQVDAGLPELLTAATTERDIAEVEVRKTALEAIARRIDSGATSVDRLRSNESAMSMLIEASQARSDDEKKETLYGQLRYTIAYTLGVIGGPQAQDALAAMLSDPLPAARFNAATGLARHGDPRCSRRLIEMLDVESDIQTDEGKPVDDATRTEYLLNAVRATQQFLSQVPDAEQRPELIAALRRVRESEMVRTEVKSELESLFEEL